MEPERIDLGSTKPEGVVAPESQEAGVEGGKKEQFVSKGDFEVAMAEVKEESRRQSQSYSMQAENRIGKVIKDGLGDLQRTIQMQKDMGIDIPADKVSAMKTKIISDAYEKEESNQSGSQAQPNQGMPNTPGAGNANIQNPQMAQPDPEAERILAEARGMAQMAGFTIDPQDPEMVELAPNLQHGISGETFKAAFAKALKAKTARLQTQGIAQNPNAVRGGSVANPDLMKEYQTKKSKLPRGEIKSHEKLRREYAEKGLNI